VVGRGPRIDPSDSSAKGAVGHRICGWQQAAPSSESPPVLPHHVFPAANQCPQHWQGGGSALGVRNLDFFPCHHRIRNQTRSGTQRETAGLPGPTLHPPAGHQSLYDLYVSTSLDSTGTSSKTVGATKKPLERSPSSTWKPPVTSLASLFPTSMKSMQMST